ncbi:uncharacterized protein LOC100576031 [Acyrthosiphon pisum]|uniref:EF-hand domain-containing protein n=1 Tax=Acyrthosiphon pisum TaxID=7029 RepID=A0A8R2AA07_ACYPI|nr:uncharacterized protein LOC100576031 [Acyrthosiphon pisum]|eukprot:XP_003243010.1 PREDICTED: uncharacterized protein LOC100576031 [Acyrthosiphon pisum]
MASSFGNDDIFELNRSKKKAESYLDEKHIMSLVNHLTSTLLKHEPDDPVEFLVNQVEEIIQFRDHSGKPPLLFSDNDLTNIFKGVDYFNSGTIDLSEYFTAMKMVGLNENEFNQNPQVDETNRIECKTFIHETKFALIKQMTKMIQ